VLSTTRLMSPNSVFTRPSPGVSQPPLQPPVTCGCCSQPVACSPADAAAGTESASLVAHPPRSV